MILVFNENRHSHADGNVWSKAHGQEDSEGLDAGCVVDCDVGGLISQRKQCVSV